MGELEDLDEAGTGYHDEPDDEADPDADLLLGEESEERMERRNRFELLDKVFDKLDLIDALDDLQAGGAGGFATSIEIIGENFAHGPYDDLLDAFEPVRDIADHTDLLDDLF